MNATQSRQGWLRLGCQALLIGVIFVVSAPAQQQSKSLDVKDVLEMILNYQATAWNDGNLEGFMDAYWKSDELTFSSGGSVTRGWKQTLARYRSSYGTKELMGHLTFSELEVTELGADAALMLGRWKLVAKGQEMGGNFSLVWRKIQGDWKIIHDHTSSFEKTVPEDKESKDN